ncbi:hypothetical protein ACROSR_16150 [Roseovarius tibetensis]|uniref:hypothetical protein n=1 Tax=Roseovarius tibetensis TaxID=2685897 RepID=UPI003D7F78C0
MKDAIGYRAASTTDAWTGVSRWDPKTQAQFKKAAKRILGHKAYARLKKSEQVVQDTVSYAKSTIIVRAVVVAYENLVSNALHLAVRGINPVKAVTGMVSKFVEITQYVKNREEINKLEIDIASNYNRTADRLRAEARIKALNDANDKLTIKPLIDAGEFSTISENLTEADVEIREGRWADYLEKATDKLPGWAQTGVKNALITKDTALFQGLNRMVQYGDFVAKAVLYDHLTQEKNVEKQDAMDEIFEEFVPYNRLPGRGRDTLESFGLLWFFSYKLRIQKIAANAVRNRPVSSVL